MAVTVYHNLSCGGSRNTPAMIRQSGEPLEALAGAANERHIKFDLELAQGG